MDVRAELMLCLLPMLLETLVLFVRPTWLLAVPLRDIDDTRFTLVRPRRSVGGYREAVGVPALPTLPERVELDDAVLFADGSRVALRRAFGLGRRAVWLVRIDITREGDELVMRARQVLSPMTLVISAPMMGWVIGHGFGVMIVIFPMIMAAVFALQAFFSRGQQHRAVLEAFESLERSLRDELEEPVRRR